MAPPVSVIICCANSEDTLEAACRSVSWADEILIVDSGSKDRTPEIAQRYATNYVQEPWRGHTGQKKFACGICKHDWVFILDSDEECSPEFLKELKSLPDKAFEKYDLFHVPRKNYIYGRFVRAWWPDRITRLFNKKKVEWTDEVLHDSRYVKDKRKQADFGGWIEHKRVSTVGWSDYFSGKRLDERLKDTAEQMYARGKRANGIDLVLRPMAAFWKSYLFKGGVWDGEFGLLIAQKAAVSTQLKYAALWAVQEERRKDGKKGSGV
jgi:(heptosyl)LPS beta-1,4-glucosyltransferase